MIDVLYFSEIDARGNCGMESLLQSALSPVSYLMDWSKEHRIGIIDQSTTRKKRVEGKKIVHSSSKKTRN
jgi:hypothetical protein